MKYKHIHFVGIKGVGMTPLAIIAKEAGCKVTGSDVGDQFITDDALAKAGITPFVGFDHVHVEGAELIIATGAHGGFENEEVKAANAKGIPVLMQGQAVGAFMQGELLGKSFTGVSVAGSHGKTTTTAMLATLLAESGKDPSYVIGSSNILPLGLPGHFGKGDIFVAEADEYATEPKSDKTAKFLWQHPKILIITNIEHDHPDIYSTVESVQQAFLQFAQQLPPEGVLVACGDAPGIQAILSQYAGQRILYGFGEKNDYHIQAVRKEGDHILFDLSNHDKLMGTFTLTVSGEHNVLNATAAIIAAEQLGLSLAEVQQGLSLFLGTKRRMEYKGILVSGALLYDDYAHHPTEISNTLAALKMRYPDKQLVCIFQPHTYSRTKSLFEEFVTSFSLADYVGIMNIYASAREVPDASISSEMLVDRIQKKQQQVSFLRDTKDVVKYLDRMQFGKDTVIVTMGAGDIYKVSEEVSMND